MKQPMKLMLLAGVLLSGQLAAQPLQAEDTNTVELIKQLQRRIEELEQKVRALQSNQPPQPGATDTQAKQRIEELDQKVKILERNRELDEEAQAARAKEAPKIIIGDRGFSFTSADTNFAVQLKALLQVDSRTFIEDAGIVGNDSLLLRRARPILSGTVFRDFDFYFAPDFAPSTPQIFDAYINYKNRPELQVRVGKFKTPVGLEYLQSDPFTMFNERAFPTELVPARDLGAMLHGEVLEATVSYAVGIFNGLGDNRNSSNVDFDDDKAFAGRVFLQPFKTLEPPGLKGLGFGVGGSYEHMQTTNTAGLPATTGGTLAGYNTVGQQQFFAYNPAAVGGRRPVVVAEGEHWRLAPQAYYYYGPFNLLAEYTISDQQVRRTVVSPASARLEHTAWQIAGGWVLTGEDASYSGPVVPRRSFNPAVGGWGAWQLVARYAELNLDHATFPLFADPVSSARAAHEWSVGLNWWMNRNIRVNGSFSHTTFDGGGEGSTPPGIVTRKDENVVFTRVQLAF